eukprot:CAMPEP_0184293616 /NCGR_PEP_ID=MMETSP1049-20130417/4995_1 /TAXON_ID=77928 /ORGANISM="Proteomonas sulcata, Strain CCMP704" /LENGTH=199 /DNA_ID=CAMNT_0026601635 /DNA_START=5 /DNA_END=604 /DNA_ORIENTATION=-
MFTEMVEEHEQMDPPGTYKVLPGQAFSVLKHVMYNRRCQQKPIWNTFLIAGFGPPAGKHVPPHIQCDSAYSEPFLGMIDMHGTPLSTSNYYTTGLGNYAALPLLRQATKEVEMFRKNSLPQALTCEEAQQVACDVMRVMSLRLERCSNRVQMARVDADGVALSAPFRLEQEWDFDGFHMNEDGCSFQEPDDHGRYRCVG